MKTFAAIAEAVGVHESKVREIAGHLGHDPSALGVVPVMVRGEAHWKAKLTPADVRKIRELCAAHWSLVDIGKDFGINPKWVAKIRDRKAWAHVA